MAEKSLYECPVADCHSTRFKIHGTTYSDVYVDENGQQVQKKHGESVWKADDTMVCCECDFVANVEVFEEGKKRDLSPMQFHNLNGPKAEYPNPSFGRSAWRHRVASGATEQSYWDWAQYAWFMSTLDERKWPTSHENDKDTVQPAEGGDAGGG